MPLEAIVPAPYSQDLRQRVIGFMALGGSARAAAIRFDVSVSSAIAGRSAGGPKAMRARARWVATVAPGWASTERGCCS